MKVKNNKGHKVTIKPEHEALVRQMHAKGDHAGISALVESYSKKRPKMKQMGGQPPAPQGDPSQQGAPQGGDQQAQMQQLLQMVAQALQQGAKPEQIMQMLVQQGVPQQVAQQVIQMVMQQMQGAQGGQPQGPVEEQQEPQQEAPQQGMQEGAPQMKAGGKLNWVVPAYGYGQNGIAIDGQFEDQKQQIERGIAAALSKGARPEQLVADLKKRNYPEDQAIQLVQSVMQQLSQTSEQEQPVAKMGIRMAQTGTGITGHKPYQNGYQNYGQSFATNNFGYNAGVAINLGNQSRQMMTAANEARVNSKNPNLTAEQAQQLNQDSANYTKQGKVDAGFSSLATGMASVDATKGILGGASTIFANQLSDQNTRDMESFAMRNNRQIMNPLNPDERYGNDRLGVKFGGRVKMLQIGGTATEGSDFRSGDPNVMTEKGETISDPTQGPTGPDGRPTGAVVHDTTGDNHSDPSGGNAYKLGKDAVVHSKVLGVRIGDFIEFAKGFPDAEKIISTIMAKFKDPNKEVSFAKIAALFDTEKLLKEVKQIEKKLEKAEKHGGPQATEPAQVTSKLNKKTLQGKIEQTKAEIQSNSDAAGAQGPIHAMSEGLKHAGAYGPKVQEEAQQQEQVPTAKHGGKITMKSKKLMLPMAQIGKDIPEGTFRLYHNPPYEGDTDAVYREGHWRIPGTNTPWQFSMQDYENERYNNAPQSYTSPAAQNLISTAAPVTQHTVTPQGTVKAPVVAAAPVTQHTVTKQGTIKAPVAAKGPKVLPKEKWMNRQIAKGAVPQVTPSSTSEVVYDPATDPAKTQGKTLEPLDQTIHSVVSPTIKMAPTTFAANPDVTANYPTQKYPQQTETGLKYGVPDAYDWANWQKKQDVSANSRGFRVPIPGQDPNELVSYQGTNPLGAGKSYPAGKVAQDYYGTSDPKTLVNKAYQEQSYDDALDSDEGTEALARMWESAGKTTAGMVSGIPVAGLSGANIDKKREVLKLLRPYYIDGKLDYRKTGYITPQDAPPDELPKAPFDVSGVLLGNLGPRGMEKGIATEGLNPWQYAGDLMTLLYPKRAAPFIQEQPVTAVRGEHQVPYLEDLRRQMVAASGQGAQDQAQGAQIKANALSEISKRLHDTGTQNVQINNQYLQDKMKVDKENNVANEKGLRQGVVDNAKLNAAAEHEYANAFSDMGYKFSSMVPMNDSARIIQQLYGNVGWTPGGGLYNVAGGPNVLHPGIASTADLAHTSKADQLVLAKIQELNAKGEYDKAKTLLAEHQVSLGKRKLGGKIGRATPKIMRKKK